ncbi:MAG: 4-hydroxy-2-oxovalerate aldolase, partial [Phycicoccus sp.]
MSTTTTATTTGPSSTTTPDDGGAAPERAFRLTDSTLRDGSHAVYHQFTADHVRRVVTALDAAGVPVIEVSHGDGLGGSSFTYGFSHTPDTDLLKVAVETARRARIAVLFVPGIG